MSFLLNSYSFAVVGGGTGPGTTFSPNWSHPSLTLSNSNKTVTHSTAGTNDTQIASSIDAKTTGQYYFEVLIVARQSVLNITVGVSTVDYNLRVNANGGNHVVMALNGTVYHPSGNVDFFTDLIDGDRVCVAVNAATRGVRIRKNNEAWATEYFLTGSFALVPIVETRNQNQECTGCFDSTDWVYSAPSGYGPWSPNADYTGRYLQFRAFDGNNAGHNIAEVIARSTAGGSNLTLSNASASSEFSPPTYNAAKAIDGNNSTFWSSNTGELNSATWQCDLGSDLPIRQILHRIRSDISQYSNPMCWRYAKSAASGVWLPAKYHTGTWTTGEQKTFAATDG